MEKLARYPFLRAAIEDYSLASAIASGGIGTPRHAVCLMHDAVEFVLDEILLANDRDIYTDGQNTLGLNDAIKECGKIGVEMPLIGTIRSIQKHRGDAKHHGQIPHDNAYSKMLAEFRVVVSKLIYEHFGAALGSAVERLGLLPYHTALFDSYRKYRNHNWKLALRFSLAALLQKHRKMLGVKDDYSAGRVMEPQRLVALLENETKVADYANTPEAVVSYFKNLPPDLRTAIKEERLQDASETSGHAYSKIDELVPSSFDLRAARVINPHLVQLDEHACSIRGCMSWSKWNRKDTEQKKAYDQALKDLLSSNRQLLHDFGKPIFETDNDRYWKWWEFAVFDGARWHTFHMDTDFVAALESGTIGGEEIQRREEVARLILQEFSEAAHIKR